MTFSQVEFDFRLEWGEHGVRLLAPVSDAIIIVDVLSFSTSVENAASRKATVYPFYDKAGDLTPREFARSIGAEVAEKHREAKFSPSPRSMLQIPGGISLILASPNGSRLSLGIGNTPTLAGCLRDARAAAGAVTKYGNRIALIPAGERWPEGSLRPSYEDLIGAGAIIHYPDGTCSPEAQAARSAFEHAEPDLKDLLVQCGAGKELGEGGDSEDVHLAAESNASHCVPTLDNGAYIRK